MTASPDPFPVKFQGPDGALGISPSAVVALQPNFFGNASDRASRAPDNISRPLAPAASAPRGSVCHRQKPIQYPVGSSRSVQ
jgi:hypothetical protein